MAKALAFLFFWMIFPAVYAVTHIVGDSSGWITGYNYDAWAAAQTFAVGDILVFNYDYTHAVDEVTQSDYQSCNTGRPLSSTSSSPTTIQLTYPGVRYFICPRNNHCNEGMRLAVNVGGPGGFYPGQFPPPPPFYYSSANTWVAGSSPLLAALLGVIMV